MHTQARLSEMTPHFIHFSSAASNDKDFLKVIKLPEGSIGVFDKGFHNFSRYKEWNDSGRFYVTRANGNINFKVLQQLPLEERTEDGVISDQVIELTYKCKTDKIEKTVKARLIAYLDPIKGEKLAFLSNEFEVKALTICLLYKNRWTIELLFKQLKGNL